MTSLSGDQGALKTKHADLKEKYDELKNEMEGLSGDLCEDCKNILEARLQNPGSESGIKLLITTPTR